MPATSSWLPPALEDVKIATKLLMSLFCVDLKQARPRVAKVAQIAYEVAEQLNCKAVKKMEEYNDTRR
jgi:hypothetical protein